MINCGLTCADVDNSSSVGSILQKHQNTTTPHHLLSQEFHLSRIFGPILQSLQKLPKIFLFIISCIGTNRNLLHWYLSIFIGKEKIVEISLLMAHWCWSNLRQKNLSKILFWRGSFMKAICKSWEFGFDIWISFPIFCILNSYKTVRLSEFHSKYEQQGSPSCTWARRYWRLWWKWSYWSFSPLYWVRFLTKDQFWISLRTAQN